MSDFSDHFLTYLPIHVRFCPILLIQFSLGCPILAKLPTTKSYVIYECPLIQYQLNLLKKLYLFTEIIIYSLGQIHNCKNLLKLGYNLVSRIKVQQTLLNCRNMPTCTPLFQPACLSNFQRFQFQHVYRTNFTNCVQLCI